MVAKSSGTWWRRLLDWEAEQAATARAYPGATFVESKREWLVPMRPIPEPDHLGPVLADLEAELPVRIITGGKTLHSPACPVVSSRHEAPVSCCPEDRRYLVRLDLPRYPFGEAGPVHPRARVGSDNPVLAGLTPEITIRTHPGHPHLSFDRSGDSWACPVTPSESTWTWGSGAIVAYLDQVAIWILKTEVWALTRRRHSASGVWLGPAVSHEPAHVLTIQPDAPCRCGLGVEYAHCHRPQDLAEWLRESRTA